jgi:uncharacterized protein YjiS (DUF1127 family)
MAGIASTETEAAGHGGARALAGLRWLRAGPGRLLEILEAWRERDRLRQELAALPERTLKDIGLTRGQVLYETRKPVWKPVERDWLARRRRENTTITVTGTVVS